MKDAECNEFRKPHIGRKAIVAYLEPFLKLPENHESAWKKVKKWRNRFHDFPIHTLPNRKPFLDELEFESWWQESQKDQATT